MSTRVRFAPSPTGLLHVGNARVALLNRLFAQATGGSFLLRLDDTDVERSSAGHAAAIETDLAWLGITWDAFARQSDRMERYRAAFERLRSAGRLYACYETPEELAFKRRRQMARGEPPRYDRAGLTMTEADRARYRAAGHEPYWRFQLDEGDIDWVDLVRGDVRFEGRHLSDPVLFRADGRPLYTLCSVVDDVELGVTHIIRGEDHVANTAVQLQLAAALGADPGRFAFAHMPLLADAGGAPLSKRLGSLSLQQLRTEGVEPLALVSLLARIGTGEAVEPAPDLDALAAGFDLGRYGRATPRFDREELSRVNAALIQRLPFEALAARLRDMGLDDIGPSFWEAVRGNIATVAEATDWHRICRGTIEPISDDPAFLAEAAASLPAEPWNADTWGLWTDQLRAATGRRGRALYRPLRMALTGREHGPEMSVLLPEIGRSRALARLGGEPAAMEGSGVVVPLGRKKS
ncbi:MAG: glutamate--tRNA ligase [Alphaproteobacteria bacterium]